ncbi:MAG: DUF3179 domain-containing (seleno)protein [Thermoanaerobaculia bacterium]
MKRAADLPPSTPRPLPPALTLLLLALLCASGSTGAELSPEEGYGLLRKMTSESARERREAAKLLADSGDASLVPGLVDAYFFLPKTARAEALAALRALSGERGSDRYHDWVEMVGRREDLAPKPGYLEWKAELFSRIDPRYKSVFYKGAPARIRLEEIVFGGVPLEGIPALDRPEHVPAGSAGAKYLLDGEKVFGVSLGGEARAYPLRILDWHEMLNDVVGGEPVTLSYCTLCGSGVLYSTRTPKGDAYTFGTSGLLYRSNKLMIDRQTLTLWNNLTGEPAVGRLARSPVRLPVLPVVVTTWKEWRTRHPGTTVLSIPEEMARRWGYSYVPGAADRARSGVSFPVWQKSKALDGKAEVYAVRLGELAKAYPVERVVRERVVNDRLGGETLVVVGDPESGAVRVYRRGERTFTAGARPGELVDEAGRRWTVGEEALFPVEVESAASTGTAPLARVPGHQAFWFGWYSFFPRTELYGASP